MKKLWSIKMERVSILLVEKERISIKKMMRKNNNSNMEIRMGKKVNQITTSL
jgi:hypothetical protein